MDIGKRELYMKRGSHASLADLEYAPSARKRCLRTVYIEYNAKFESRLDMQQTSYLNLV